MESLFELSPSIILIVPVLIGLVAVAKTIGVSSKLAPATALVLGIGLVSLTGVEWQVMIVQGIIAGLSASGLYSGTRATLK